MTVSLVDPGFNPVEVFLEFAGPFLVGRLEVARVILSALARLKTRSMRIATSFLLASLSGGIELNLDPVSEGTATREILPVFSRINAPIDTAESQFGVAVNETLKITFEILRTNLEVVEFPN